MPARVHWGSLNDLEPLVRGKRVFIVSGSRTLGREPIGSAFEGIFTDAVYMTGHAVTPNPGFCLANTLADQMRAFGPDLIIAIGGGSAMDAAKAARISASGNAGVEEYFIKKKAAPLGMPPLIAVPTTSGTGSEVTPVSVLVNEADLSKISYTSPMLIPETALLDPGLTYSMPARVTASTGMDALCHALESLWSRRSNPLTRIFASRAVKGVLTSLASSCMSNKDSRDSMMYSSLLAGLAFSNTGVTGIHPASYPLTTMFGVPHGHACAMFLPGFIRFNMKDLSGDIRDIILNTFECSNTHEIIARVDDLMQQTGLCTRFSELGITIRDIEGIASRGIGRSTANNPKRVEKQDIATMIEEKL